MERKTRPHAYVTYQAYKTLREFREGQGSGLNGSNLDISKVVAVAKYGCTPDLDLNAERVLGLWRSVDVLKDYLEKGFFVYGM